MQTGQKPTPITDKEWVKVSGKRFSNSGNGFLGYFIGKAGTHEPLETSIGHPLHPSKGVTIDEFDGDEDIWFIGNSQVTVTG